MPVFHLQDLLSQAALRFPQWTFLFDDRQSLTFAEAASQVERLAVGMLKMGAQAGDRVLVVSENRVDLPLATLAATRAGLVFSVLTSQITGESFQRIVGQCEPSLIYLN